MRVNLPNCEYFYREQIFVIEIYRHTVIYEDYSVLLSRKLISCDIFWLSATCYSIFWYLCIIEGNAELLLVLKNKYVDLCLEFLMLMSNSNVFPFILLVGKYWFLRHVLFFIKLFLETVLLNKRIPRYLRRRSAVNVSTSTCYIIINTAKNLSK